MPALFGSGEDESKAVYQSFNGDHDIELEHSVSQRPSLKHRIKQSWSHSSLGQLFANSGNGSSGSSSGLGNGRGNGHSQSLLSSSSSSSVSVNYDSDDDDALAAPITATSARSLPFYQRWLLELRSIYAAQLMSMTYLRAETRRNLKGFGVGLFTVLLVVAVIALIQNNTLKSPIIFFKIAENSVGEIDVLLTPSSGSNGVTATSVGGLPFLNQSHFDRTVTPDSTLSSGTSGRWVFFTKVLNPQHTDSRNLTASCVMLGVNSVREKMIGLGRSWDRPPLVGKSAYLSRSIVRQIGYSVSEAVGKTVLLRLSVFDIASQLGDSTSTDGANVSVQTVESLLNVIDPTTFNDTFWAQSFSFSIATNATRVPYPSGGNYSEIVHEAIYDGAVYQLPFVPFPATIPTYLRELRVATNVSITPEQLEQNLLAVPPPPAPGQPAIARLLMGQSINVTNEMLLELLLPSLINASIHTDNFTVSGVVDEPDGKWPEALGSIAMLESETMIQFVKDSVLALVNANISSIDFTDLLGPIIVNNRTVTIPLPNVSLRTILEILSRNRLAPSTITDAINTIDSIDGNKQSLLSVMEAKNRLTMYIQDLDAINNDLLAFTNNVALSIGLDYPASWTTPIATTLTLTQYIRYFLDNIFYSVVALMAFLGSLLIFSLMLHDVDAKTYEYGMLRALGMRHRTLVQVLVSKSLLFAIPGIMIGLFLAFLGNIPIDAYISDYAVIPHSLSFSSTPLLLSVGIGLLLPLAANIVPISRALSRTLRDSLDVYHHVISETTVRIIKLADLGLDLWQTCLALLMVLVGFITFYVVPYAFIFGKIPLFLAILNGILLGMLLGLCIIAQAVQPYIERAVLRVILTVLWFHRHLRPVVAKNLSGHRGRNAKTAQMFTICLAFIVFSGVMFALQANSLIDNVKVFLGADINVQALPNDFANALKESEMTALLEVEKAKYGSGDSDGIVVDYTFVPFPINSLPGVRSVQFSSLPQFRSVRNYVYGVSENFLNVVYDEYYIATEYSESTDGSDYPRTRSGKPDAIARMYEDAGQARLPEERNGIVVPASTTSAPTAQTFNAYYNDSAVRAYLFGDYHDYLDVIMGEALRGWQSVNSHTALNLYIRTRQDNSDLTIINNRLCKARAMVSKVPGFLYSSYRVSASISAVLVRQMQYEELMVDAIGADNSVIVNGLSPKQRLLIRLVPGSTLEQREDLINSLRTFFASDRTVVTDTQKIIDTTMMAVNLMNLFFQSIGIITMVMCFFILWLSFSANVEENSWEFGVLRALGLNQYEVVTIYVYEALALVVTSLLLGTAIGLIIAASLTAQFNLFIEMPFRMSFPHSLYWTLVVLAVVIAIIGSALPAYRYLRKAISAVLRGQ